MNMDHRKRVFLVTGSVWSLTKQGGLYLLGHGWVSVKDQKRRSGDQRGWMRASYFFQNIRPLSKNQTPKANACRNNMFTSHLVAGYLRSWPRSTQGTIASDCLSAKFQRSDREEKLGCRTVRAWAERTRFLEINSPAEENKEQRKPEEESGKGRALEP